MENQKYYVCQICGCCGTSSDRFPICNYCGNENMLEFEPEFIEFVKEQIKNLPEAERERLEKGETEFDAKYDIKSNVSLAEYMRRKYVFTNEQFSKLKYNQRIQKDTKTVNHMNQKFAEAEEQVYGTPNPYRKITCPTCGSTNTRKISGLSKAASVGLFGIFSQKVKHQFHCNSCGYEW